jgi:hypothetical protein
MPIDINGYSLSNASGLKLGASNSKILAANYGVSDPMLPGMLGSATANGAYKVYPFPVNDVNLNTGSPWNTGTFRFTAPVSGIYYTSYSGITGNGTLTGCNGYMVALIVNGGNWYFSYKDTINSWELDHVEMMLNLAAGDWFSWAMNIAPGPDAGTNAGSYQANHNTCTVWLVG